MYWDGEAIYKQGEPSTLLELNGFSEEDENSSGN
jgi:hypothetical protein